MVKIRFRLFFYLKKNSMAIKPEGGGPGGGTALMACHQEKNFFAASLSWYLYFYYRSFHHSLPVTTVDIRWKNGKELWNALYKQATKTTYANQKKIIYTNIYFFFIFHF